MKEPRTENQEGTTRNLRRIVQYGVAVAAIIVLVFLIIGVYKFYTLSPEKLYNENYKPYELTTAPDESASPIEKAWREKKYGAVINLNKTSVLSVKDVFLTGMSFLETYDYSRAISSLQVVIAEAKDNKSQLKDTAEYYLALAFLRNRDYDQAIELMNAIRNNSSHQYKDKFSRKYINRVKRLKWR